jgi:long-chain acyl-CoA synthetase
VSGDAVLLTGATGFLGGELLVRWLERTDRDVVALVRAPSAAAASDRLDATLHGLTADADAYRDRVQAVAADVTAPGLGLTAREADALAERVDTVVHCAASVNFEMALPEARAINVEGTRRVLALAAHCARRGDGLRRYGHVSTAYVAGARRGVAAEDDLDCGAPFNNAYERSKAEAERHVRAAAAELPVQVYRPSIVVGDSGTGWTSAFNVLYAPLRAFAMGAFPIIPARRSAPVDVVPVDYVADAVLALAEGDDGVGETFHLVAGERASTVGELIALGQAELGGSPPRVVAPVLWRLAAPLLRRRMPTRTRLVLERSDAYFPYFATRVRFDARRAQARLAPAGIRPPALPEYFDRLIRFARAARWGRKPVPRARAAVAA